MTARRVRPRPATLCLAALLLLCGGCEEQSEAQAPAAPERRVSVTAAVAEARPVEVLERTLGHLDAPALPAVAAETAGRVNRTLVEEGQAVTAGQLLATLEDERQRLALESAEATVRRLEALLANQRRVVERLTRLAAEQNASESLLDEAQAQARALAAQLEEAEARQRQAARDLAETRVRSPLDGLVQRRHVSLGDYVAAGEPYFDIVQQDRLRAYLPFPETLAPRIRPGMTVRLTQVGGRDASVTATVAEIRPVIGSNSRAVEAIAEFANPGGWRAGGTVVGQLVMEERTGSVVVPEASVVQRPNGTVVYALEDGRARERVVQVGVARDGWAEILSGLSAGERVAEDGAGFLTHGTAVEVKEGAT